MFRRKKPTRLRPGDKIGAYEVIEWLGVDAISVHYRVRAVAGPYAGRSVFVKRLENVDNEQFVSMFVDEAQLGEILQHPNIAQLYEVGRADDCHFMAFEYVDGEYLYRITDTIHDRRLPLPAALAVGTGIAAGLHYAHEKTSDTGSPLEIRHGHLSPATVIVALDGQVKLIDFCRVRIPLEIIGKPRYLSPEQCRGKRIDRRSDVFSLGVVLYKATTGRFPFDGSTDYEIMSAMLEKEVEPPSRRDPTYPRVLERIVLTALDRDPARRYQTALNLGDDLAAAATELGIESSPALLAQLCRELRRT